MPRVAPSGWKACRYLGVFSTPNSRTRADKFVTSKETTTTTTKTTNAKPPTTATTTTTPTTTTTTPTTSNVLSYSNHTTTSNTTTHSSTSTRSNHRTPTVHSTTISIFNLAWIATFQTLNLVIKQKCMYNYSNTSRMKQRLSFNRSEFHQLVTLFMFLACLMLSLFVLHCS